VLMFEQSAPDNSAWQRWGVFTETGNLLWQALTLKQLLQVLSFTIHPVTLSSDFLRRHHATQTYVERETTPLGFEIWRRITHRS